MDHAVGRESLGVQRGIVAKIDKQLGGAGIGAGGGEDDGSLLVALAVEIILDLGVFPGRADRGVGGETELGNETGDDTEEAGVIEVMMLDQVVEAVGTVGRPGTRYGDSEIAASSFEFDLVGIGGGVLEKSGLEQRAV